MQKMIDAHAHLRPRGIANTYNKQFNVKYGNYGQLTLNGTWTLQGMPEYVVNSEFLDDTLVHVMDCYGIEKAVIMAAASSDTCVSLDAVKKYPDRLVAAMWVHYDDNMPVEIREKYSEGYRLIKFETSTVLGYTHPTMYPDFKFNSTIMKNGLRVCDELSIPIVIDPGVPFSKGYQVEELEEVIKEFPNIHFVICHLGVPSYPHVNGSKEDIRWRQMLNLASHKNVWFDICAIPNLFKEEEYPYKNGVARVKEFTEKYGYDKVLWGTDLPTTYVNCTLRQMINMFDRSPLFNEEQKNLMFYENAKKAYFL